MIPYFLGFLPWKAVWEVVKRSARKPRHFSHCAGEVRVRVVIQRHSDAGVAHDVLQRLRVHATVRHIGAERVPQGVGRHGPRQRLLVGSVVFLRQPSEHVVVAVARPRVPPAVEEQEAGVSVDGWGLHARIAGDHTAERPGDLLAHGDAPVPALGLGRGDVAASLLAPQQLVVHVDRHGVEVDVRLGQPAQFGDAKPGAEQDGEIVRVFPVHLVAPHEVQQAFRLRGGERDFGRGVVLDDLVQPETEGVAADEVVLYGGVERGVEGAFPVPDGLVGHPVLLHADGPRLRVAGPHVPDGHGPEGVFLQLAHEPFPPGLGAVAHVAALGGLQAVELCDGHPAAQMVDAVLTVAPYGLLLLTEGGACAFPGGDRIGGGQLP